MSKKSEGKNPPLSREEVSEICRKGREKMAKLGIRQVDIGSFLTDLEEEGLDTALKNAITPPPVSKEGPISAQDPKVLLESFLQFGRSPDGSVERDLRHASRNLKVGELPEDVVKAIANSKHPDECHPSHDTRISDASSFDEICMNCGATDQLGSWGQLRYPCPAVKPKEDIEDGW